MRRGLDGGEAGEGQGTSGRGLRKGGQGKGERGPGRERQRNGNGEEEKLEEGNRPVSYTHLTLPTSDGV